jgi:hypothetical protein
MLSDVVLDVRVYCGLKIEPVHYLGISPIHIPAVWIQMKHEIKEIYALK